MEKKNIIILAISEIEMRFLIHLYLRGLGFNILVATDKSSMTVLARTRKPLMVIIDENLSGLVNKEEVAKLVKDKKIGDIPLIVLSSGDTDEVIKDIKNIEVIKKPFEKEEVLQVIKEKSGRVPDKTTGQSSSSIVTYKQIFGILEDIISSSPSETIEKFSDKEREELKKVLVVDDEKEQRDLVKVMLRSKYQVKEAKSGENMIDVVRADKPDLIISDVLMPGMSGFRAVGKLKKDKEFEDIPVIFSSGRVTDEELYGTLKPKGKSCFLAKPVDRDVLLKTIEELLK